MPNWTNASLDFFSFQWTRPPTLIKQKIDSLLRFHSENPPQNIQQNFEIEVGRLFSMWNPDMLSYIIFAIFNLFAIYAEVASPSGV